MDEINNLLSNSVQILNTNSNLSDILDGEGQLYDSLWWLDGWEPEFIRDKDKSLRENLKDFQTAMTAVQVPVVPEEADSLPFTEPLEMEFYSGAGAWRTCLTLNPDGSFVGDYCDADVNTLHVCQFHGQFGKVEKLTDSSWLLTLSELEIDTGHEPGTELYGALEFQSWMHKHHEFNSADDILGCWGLLNMETGRGFFNN